MVRDGVGDPAVQNMGEHHDFISVNDMIALNPNIPSSLTWDVMETCIHVWLFKGPQPVTLVKIWLCLHVTFILIAALQFTFFLAMDTHGK